MNVRRTLVGVAVIAVAGSVAAAQCGPKSEQQAQHGAGLVQVRMDGAGQATKPTKDIVETAVGAGTFNTLVAAVQAAGLVDTLKGPGPFTVFAPSDAAFKKLPAGTLENLLKPENKQALANILTFHVVSGNVLAKDVKTGGVPSVLGQRLNLRAEGGKVTVNGANVTATDIVTSNGVIHVIDSVILPSSKNIVETAVANGNFKTLASLLQQAELVGALSGPGPFTVFAPTDEAFAKLPPEVVADLMKSENKAKLANILKFHVIPGRVYSDAAAKGATVKTLQGGELTSKAAGGKVTIGNATITGVDIETSNGVIHVIDTVLLPKN